MSQMTRRWTLWLVVAAALALTFAAAAGEPGDPNLAVNAAGFPDISYRVETAGGLVNTVIPASKWDLSPPLSELAKTPSYMRVKTGVRERENCILPRAMSPEEAFAQDPVVQAWPGLEAMPAPGVDFEGINNIAGYYPPDPSGAIGPDHFVEWINVHMAIYSRTGTQLWGPLPGNTIWTGFGGPCDSCNDGDPVVLYDRLAGRWLISQFANVNSGSGPYYQYVAVSQTGDPLGSWYRYSFTWPGNMLNDYPKFGVWPDGYYMTAHQFTPPSWAWAGQGVAVLDRAAMLTGGVATIQSFSLLTANANFGGLLPCDLDGTVPPPGTPAYFGSADDGASIGPSDAFRVWEFHTDWTTPANSTFGLTGQPNQILPVAAFNLLPCTTSGSRSCVPQSGTATKLDGIGDRLMYRLQYRNFGSHQTLVASHTVWADGTDRAGVRWYELRGDGTTWAIHQQGTFAPADGLYRWMGSAAMNKSGTLAIAYSTSSASTYPSIRYAGRLATDPLGELTQGEATLVNGIGAQTGTGSRWGDYTMMTMDPLDDCTFWYVGEYMGTTSSTGWKTRVASFSIPCCITPGSATIGSAAVPGDNQIKVNWSAGSPAGVTYNVYRATGTCPGGAYTLVKLGQTGTSWTDTAVSGGVTYSYKVTAVDTTGGCESAQSGCVSATATGPCITAPTFSGLASVTSSPAATCGLSLSWSAGSTTCASGGVTYNLYRSTSPSFTPDGSNLLAAGLTGTTATDTNGLLNGTTYYYIVRAVDATNGLDDGNTTRRSGTPAGPQSTLGYAATDVPKTIADNATVESNLVIADTSPLADVNVTIGNLTHTYDADLDIYLVHPDGTVVELSTDNGGAGDNFVSTVFDDAAATLVTAGTAPFTGTYRPEGSLAALNGKPANGTWKLRITDDATTDTGTLTAWSLSLTTSSACGTLYAPGEAAPGANSATAQTWLADKKTHGWPALSGATSYTVYRGVQSQLPNLLTGGTDSCTRYSGGATSFNAFEEPAAGSFYWYLVVGGNGAGNGTAGNATSGARVVNTSGVCP